MIVRKLSWRDLVQDGWYAVGIVNQKALQLHPHAPMLRHNLDPSIHALKILFQMFRVESLTAL